MFRFACRGDGCAARRARHPRRSRHRSRAALKGRRYITISKYAPAAFARGHLVCDCLRSATGGRFAERGGHDAGKLGAQLFVGIAREIGTQIFAGLAQFDIRGEQARDRVRNLGSGAAVADGTGNALILAERAAEREIERVDDVLALLDLFAFEADIGDPVLAAGIGAAGDVELELLVELRDALLEFVDEPAGEALRLR